MKVWSWVIAVVGGLIVYRLLSVFFGLAFVVAGLAGLIALPHAVNWVAAYYQW